MRQESNPICYWTKCGCKLSKKDIVRSYNVPLCRKHRKVIIKRTKMCLDCEREFVIKGKRGSSLRCPECHKTRRAEIHRKAARKQYKKIVAARVKAAKVKPVEMLPVKKFVNPIPKKMRPFIKNWRGDYCRKIFMCMKTFKDLPCSECKSPVWIFPRTGQENIPQFTI